MSWFDYVIAAVAVVILVWAIVGLVSAAGRRMRGE